MSFCPEGPEPIMQITSSTSQNSAEIGSLQIQIK